MKRFALVLTGCLLFALAARAQDAVPVSTPAPVTNGLTEASIRQFYQASADVYKLPYEKFSSFMQSALADQFQVTSVSTITLPGQPARQATTTQTRNEALAQLHQTYDGMKNASILVSVDHIQIAPSGLSATAHSTATAHGLTFPGQQHMTGDTTMSCNDQLIYTPTGLIQILKSQCEETLTQQTGEATGLGQ